MKSVSDLQVQYGQALLALTMSCAAQLARVRNVSQRRSPARATVLPFIPTFQAWKPSSPLKQRV